MKELVPTEAEECKILVAYLRVRNLTFTHIANETGYGRHAKLMGIRNKQMGVSKGFPDYLVIVGGRLIAIEMKRVKGSTVSQEQKEWIEELNKAGIVAKICRGADDAIKFVQQFETKK